jgi:hypothetical protein
MTEDSPNRPSTGGALVPNGDITLREVYGLIEGVRKELLAEIKGVSKEVESSLQSHDSEHQLHDERHEREKDHRSGLFRWAVTSVLSGVGVLVALYVAFYYN